MHSAIGPAESENRNLPSPGRLTGKPHLTLVSVGCCSRARVCLDLRSENQIFVDPAAFVGTDHARRIGVTPGRAIPVSLPLPIPPSAHATLWQPVYNTSGGQPRRTSSDPARPG